VSANISTQDAEKFNWQLWSKILARKKFQQNRYKQTYKVSSNKLLLSSLTQGNKFWQIWGSLDSVETKSHLCKP
jgi:hypothetical protein